MEKDELIDYAEQFLGYISRTRKFSNNTLDAYRNDIVKFMNYLTGRGIRSFNDVNEKIALDYYDFLKGILKDRSLMRNISSLKNLFNYLKRKGLFKKKNPFSEIKFRGIIPRKIATLSIKDIEKLTKVLNSNGFIESRNRAMILFIYNTGLKASEIAKAKIGNLDLKKATYTCNEGNVKRTIPFSKELVPILRDYLEKREYLLAKARLRRTGKKYLFVNRRGGKITRQTVYIVVQNKANEAGLGKGVTPSALRNSLALHLLSSGVHENVVKSILGYTTIVPKYTYSPDVKKTKFIFLATHPAFKKR